MIEKNIRLQPHHSRDLLVGRRSDGRRPKYQPPGYGSSSAHDSGSRGGPPGGGDRQMTYSAPSPSPHRQDRARQQAAAEAIAREKEKEKEKEQFDADWDFENILK